EGAERGRIGSGFRLRKTEGGSNLARGKARQILPFLLLRPGHDKALTADADRRADDGAKRQRRLAELMDHFAFLRHAEAEPAIFLRDGEAEQAKFAHFLNDVFRHLV